MMDVFDFRRVLAAETRFAYSSLSEVKAIRNAVPEPPARTVVLFRSIERTPQGGDLPGLRLGGLPPAKELTGSTFPSGTESPNEPKNKRRSRARAVPVMRQLADALEGTTGERMSKLAVGFHLPRAYRPAV